MKNFLVSIVLIAMAIVFTNTVVNAQTGGREDKIYVVENVEILTFDELDYAFYQAYNSFLAGNDGMSGARIKRAAYFVRLESEDAKAHNKKPILNQAKRLEMFADSVALGRINSAWRLRRAFAHTHNVLANDYQLRAAAFWTADKAQDAGQAMVSAAGYLGHAAKWVGVKVEEGAVGSAKAVANTGKKVGKGTTKAAKAAGKGVATAGVESYRGIRWISGKMVKGVGFVPEKVGQGLEWLGQGIKKVGDKVEPDPRQPK